LSKLYTPDSYLYTFDYEGRRQTVAKSELEARVNLFYKLAKGIMTYSEFNQKCILKNKAFEKEGRIRYNKYVLREQEDNWKELDREMTTEHELSLL
jgi:hypothetical protein